MFELIDSMKQIKASSDSLLNFSLEEGVTFYDSSYLVSAFDPCYDFVTDDIKLYRIASTKLITRVLDPIRFGQHEHGERLI